MKSPTVPLVITGLLVAIIGGGIGVYFHILEATLVGGISGGLSLAEHAQLSPPWAIPILIGGLFVWGGIANRSGAQHRSDQNEG